MQTHMICTLYHIHDDCSSNHMGATVNVDVEVDAPCKAIKVSLCHAARTERSPFELYRE